MKNSPVQNPTGYKEFCYITSLSYTAPKSGESLIM